MYETLIHAIRQALGHHSRAIDAPLVHSLIERLHASDVAFVLDELTLPEAERVFALLDDERSAEALVQMAPATTAGRLMTTKYVGLPLGLTAERAVDYVRAVAATVETVNVLYILDDRHELAGVCSIRDLLVAAPYQVIDEVMRSDVITVSAFTDQQEVARIIGRYDLSAVPVVDANGRMLGIVTVDDVLDVLTDEFNEDIAGLVGSDAAEMERRTPVQIARLRLPWLLGTMAIELCAGAIISQFDAVLREVILLASFMPVISAVSGNVGLQAAAIIVRGLDTGHVSVENWPAALRREVLTALSIAVVAGSILAGIAVTWSRHWPFGIVVGAAMTCAVVAAGVMGTLIPLVSKRLGFDPATTAGPFETAFQDVIGFTVFLWMAARLARWLA